MVLHEHLENCPSLYFNLYSVSKVCKCRQVNRGSLRGTQCGIFTPLRNDFVVCNVALIFGWLLPKSDLRNWFFPESDCHKGGVTIVYITTSMRRQCVGEYNRMILLHVRSLLLMAEFGLYLGLLTDFFTVQLSCFVCVKPTLMPARSFRLLPCVHECERLRTCLVMMSIQRVDQRSGSYRDVLSKDWTPGYVVSLSDSLYCLLMWQHT